jgi:general secretion pathway protein G
MGRGARRPARGFTLIEIMVVVIIIGLLAAVVVMNISKPLDTSRITKARADISQFQTALKLYYMDNARYPTSAQGLKALVTQPEDPTITHWHRYLDGGLQKDPWGHDYVYAFPSTHGEDYDVYSLGANGDQAGEGTSTYIGNWAASSSSQ